MTGIWSGKALGPGSTLLHGDRSMSAVVTVIQIIIGSAALGAAIPAGLANRHRMLAMVMLVTVAALCCTAFAEPLIDRLADASVRRLTLG